MLADIYATSSVTDDAGNRCPPARQHQRGPRQRAVPHGPRPGAAQPSSRSAWPSASPPWRSPPPSHDAGERRAVDLDRPTPVTPLAQHRRAQPAACPTRRPPPTHRARRLPGAPAARQRSPDHPVRLHRRLAHVRLHAARLLLHRQDARPGRRRRLQRLCVAERAQGDQASSPRTAAIARSTSGCVAGTPAATCRRRFGAWRPCDRSRTATSRSWKPGSRPPTSTPASERGVRRVTLSSRRGGGGRRGSTSRARASGWSSRAPSRCR